MTANENKVEVSAANVGCTPETFSRFRTSELIGKMSDDEFVETMVRCRESGKIELSPGSVRPWQEVYDSCVKSKFGARHHLKSMIGGLLASAADKASPEDMV